FVEMRVTILVLSLFTAWPAAAQEVDGGDVDAGPTEQSGSDNGVPLACDGGLCDTTNMSTITDYVCSVVVGRASRPEGGVLLALIGLGLVLGGRTFRRRAGKITVVVVLLAAMSGRAALAAPPPPVDVTIQEAPPNHRTLVLAWNPLSMILTRPSFD